MSHQSSSSTTYTSYTSTSSTSSSSSDPQTHAYTQTTRSTFSPSSGGTSRRTTSETGKSTVVETASIPAQVENSGNGNGRIEDVTDKQREEREAEERYLEAMEDEYAKREGGA